MSRPVLVLLLALASSTVATARNGTVRTRDGQDLTGAVFFEPTGAVQVIPPVGPRVRVPFANLNAITFQPDDTAIPATTTPMRGLPAPWTALQLSAFGMAGSVVCSGQTFEVKGSGLDGSGYFVHQTITGNGAIVARVANVTHPEPLATAGVMLRKDLTEDSPFVLLAATPGNRGQLQARVNAGRAAPQANTMELPLPRWLKLSREDDRVVTTTSADGQKWEPVAQTRLPLGQTAFIGLAVASHNLHTLNQVVFDQVAVTIAPPEQMLQAVVLRTGTRVPAAIQSVDGIHVKFRSYGRDFAVPQMDVARLQLRAVAPERLNGIAPGRLGVLLANGDFFDGEFAGLDAKELKINSVMFGSRSFTVATEVALIVLREFLPPAAAWQIAFRNGTVLNTAQFTLQGDSLLLQDPNLGKFEVPITEITEMHHRRRP